MCDKGLLLSHNINPTIITTKMPPNRNHIRGISSSKGIEIWASEYLLNAWNQSKTIPNTYNAVALAIIKMMPALLIYTQTSIADFRVLKG